MTTKSLTANVATVTCSAPHGFSVGEAVLVALSPGDPIFDGNYTISAVTPDSFSYARTSANQAATAVAGTARQSFFGKTDRNRGMCYNPATDHLLVSRVAPGIQILSAQDGSGIGQLNMTGVEAAGALYLMKVRALSNGAIYACNLATQQQDPAPDHLSLGQRGGRAGRGLPQRRLRRFRPRNPDRPGHARRGSGNPPHRRRHGPPL